MVPAIEAHRIEAQTRKAPRPLIKAPPAHLRTSALPGSPGGPPVNITGRHPLPEGTRLTPVSELHGRFHLSLAPGWKAQPPSDPGAGPALELTPPADAPKGTYGAVYHSGLPQIGPEAFFTAIVGGVRMRGEKLLEARKVQDGKQQGYEVLTEVKGPHGRMVQRSLYVWSGQHTAQLLVRTPHGDYAAMAPQFYAMGRTLRLGKGR